MRGIIVHFRKACEEEIKKWLNTNFSRRIEYSDWVFPNNANPILWMGIYQDCLTELEPEEYSKLIEALGKEPSTSVAVEISGRVDGTKELNDFVLQILSAFDGLVADDYSEHFWSKQEIEENKFFDGKQFFDFKNI